VVSKPVAGREKDLVSAGALLVHGVVEPTVPVERVAMLVDARPVAVERIRGWLRGVSGRRA
jgi:hypothetical protein